MALEPFFSLSPLHPYAYTYNAANPDEPYTSAYLNSFGSIMFANPPYRLTDQHSNDELILGSDPVDPADQTFADLVTSFYRRNAIRFVFYGHNVSTENQYLLLFSLRKLSGSPIVQFFADTTLVRSEELSGEEQVAILMDVPGNNLWVSVVLRLAAQDIYSWFGFKGMDCYLL